MTLARNDVRGLFQTLDIYVPAAAENIFAGSLCTRNAAGHASKLNLGEIFAGLALEQTDNSDGTAGGKDVSLRAGLFAATMAMTGVATTDIGRAVFATDENTLTFDPAGAADSNVFVGQIWNYRSATEADILFNTITGGVVQPSVELIRLFDDFLGAALTARWTTVDVGDATEGIDPDEHGGAMKLLIAATDEAEDAVIYAGDELNFDIDKLQFMRMRAKAITPGTGIAVVFGMGSAHHLDKDTMTENAWFRLQASLALLVETDDGTNDEDDTATGVTLVTDVYNDFMIDFRDTADVKFYVNGTQVASGTTFNMSNYSGNLQPYFSCDKASGTGTAQLIIEMLEIIAER